jgi:RNA polymerase sigma factor (sigma-70 family)
MAASDDDAELEALFRAEYGPLVSAVRLVVGSTARAEEITQDAFCKCFEQWGRVRQHDRPGAWVRVVALRMAVRSERRARWGALLTPAWNASSSRHPTDADLDLQQAIAGLSRNQRTAVVLHHLLDLPVAEVAEVMGVQAGTVKAHLHRARSNLAARLGEAGGTDEGEVLDGRHR